MKTLIVLLVLAVIPLLAGDLPETQPYHIRPPATDQPWQVARDRQVLLAATIAPKPDAISRRDPVPPVPPAAPVLSISGSSLLAPGVTGHLAVQGLILPCQYDLAVFGPSNGDAVTRRVLVDWITSPPPEVELTATVSGSYTVVVTASVSGGFTKATTSVVVGVAPPPPPVGPVGPVVPPAPVVSKLSVLVAYNNATLGNIPELQNEMLYGPETRAGSLLSYLNTHCLADTANLAQWRVMATGTQPDAGTPAWLLPLLAKAGSPGIIVQSGTSGAITVLPLPPDDPTAIQAMQPFGGP